jgi:hypothetical protein
MSTRRRATLRGVIENLSKQIANADNANRDKLLQRLRFLTEFYEKGYSNDNINNNIYDLIKGIITIYRLRKNKAMPLAALTEIRRKLLNGESILIDALVSLLPEDILADYRNLIEPLRIQLNKMYPNGIDKYDIYRLNGRQLLIDVHGIDPDNVTLGSIGKLVFTGKIPWAAKSNFALSKKINAGNIAKHVAALNAHAAELNNVPPGPELVEEEAGNASQPATTGNALNELGPQPAGSSSASLGHAAPATTGNALNELGPSMPLAVRPHGAVIRVNNEESLDARNRSNSTNSFETAIGNFSNNQNAPAPAPAPAPINDAPPPLYRLNNVLRRGVNPLIAARGLQVPAPVRNAPAPAPAPAPVPNARLSQRKSKKRKSTNGLLGILTRGRNKVAPAPVPALAPPVNARILGVEQAAAPPPPPGLTLRIPVANSRSNGFSTKIAKTLKKKKSPFT